LANESCHRGAIPDADSFAQGALLHADLQTGVECLPVFSRALLKVAESDIPTRSGRLSVTVSIGVATATSENSVDEILAAADASLYLAKNDGRNRISYNGRCFFEENIRCTS